LIGQIYVAEQRDNNYISKEIILIPRIGDMNIEFGNAQDIDMKFKKLKLFYKKIYPFIDRNKYETVNINFNNQIILK
jgi:cell division protein FtsQ